MNSLSVEVAPSELRANEFTVSVEVGSELWTVPRTAADFFELQSSLSAMKTSEAVKFGLRPLAGDDPISASSEFAAFLRQAIQTPEALASDVLSSFLGSLKARIASLPTAVAPLSGLDEQCTEDADMEDENPSAPAGPRAFAAVEYPLQSTGSAKDAGLTHSGSPFEYSVSDDGRSECGEMATFLRFALMPYVANVVFPTEAVLGDIAADLSTGDVDAAMVKVKQSTYATSPHHFSPAYSKEDGSVVGFSFVPGFAGVPPTPPSSPMASRAPFASTEDTAEARKAASSCEASFVSCLSPPSSPTIDRRAVASGGAGSDISGPIAGVSSSSSSSAWRDAVGGAVYEFPRAPASSPVSGALCKAGGGGGACSPVSDSDVAMHGHIVNAGVAIAVRDGGDAATLTTFEVAGLSFE